MVSSGLGLIGWLSYPQNLFARLQQVEICAECLKIGFRKGA
jgi:hypothetical protein